MTILEEIIRYKYTEVAEAKAKKSIDELTRSPYFEQPVISLSASLRERKTPGVITEFKRKSPSRGIFNESFSPAEITKGYEDAGAVALSILTDYKYFGGSEADVLAARENVKIPILRKEFMVDEYQVYEAKAMGADLILLIAAAIDRPTVARLARTAKELGLETLLEVHEASELEGNLSDDIDMVGVNNRNLKDFSVDIDRSKKVAALIPNHFIKIAESGISQPEVIRDLWAHGFKGFLLGEAFMQTPDPIASCKKLLGSI